MFVLVCSDGLKAEQLGNVHVHGLEESPRPRSWGPSGRMAWGCLESASAYIDEDGDAGSGGYLNLTRAERPIKYS